MGPVTPPCRVRVLFLTDAERLEVPLVRIVEQASRERPSGVQSNEVGAGGPGGDVVEVRPCCPAWTYTRREHRCGQNGSCCDQVDRPRREKLVIGGVEDM